MTEYTLMWTPWDAPLAKHFNKIAKKLEETEGVVVKNVEGQNNPFLTLVTIDTTPEILENLKRDVFLGWSVAPH
jgi:hypothetical protein